MLQSIRGSLQEPTPGSGTRRIQAYAKRAADDEQRTVIYAPAPEIEEPEARAAQIKQHEVKLHGGTPGCPGCNAIQTGKGRNHHSFECRQRFERLLRSNSKSKMRFERAAERRLEGITKRAMAMEPAEPEAATNSNAASGSGATAEEKSADISAQNAKAVEDGIKASLKRKSEDSGDDVERETRGSAPSPRGRKRDAEDEADDEERMNRDTSVQQTLER